MITVAVKKTFDGYHVKLKSSDPTDFNNAIGTLKSYIHASARSYDPQSRHFTAAEMKSAFPAASEAAPKPQRPPKTLLELTGDLEDYKREIGARICSHSTARRNGRGNWDCRAVCHNGKGVTGLFYDPSQNFVWCNAELSCDLDTIALAFGITRARGAA
jgi:hypothetical protein